MADKGYIEGLKRERDLYFGAQGPSSGRALTIQAELDRLEAAEERAKAAGNEEAAASRPPAGRATAQGRQQKT